MIRFDRSFMKCRTAFRRTAPVALCGLTANAGIRRSPTQKRTFSKQAAVIRRGGRLLSAQGRAWRAGGPAVEVTDRLDDIEALLEKDKVLLAAQLQAIADMASLRSPVSEGFRASWLL